MISSVSIKNFQSHKATKLEFSPGINAIIGPSDNGKSAILRALFWAIFNRPLGEAYISSWARDAKGKQKADTSIIVEKDGKQLCRIRSKDFNGYLIGEDKLEALRTEVPDQVKSFFNINAVNVQRQHDPAFLVSAGGIEVAKFFNELIRLDQIDYALSLAESKRRDARKEDKRNTEDLERLEKDLEAFAWLEGVQILLEKAKIYNDKLVPKIKLIETLSDSAERYQTAQNTIAQSSWVPKVEKLLKEAAKIQPELEKAERLADELGLQQINYRRAKKSIDTTKWIERVSECLAAADDLSGQYMETEIQLKELKNGLKRYETSEKQVRQAKKLNQVSKLLEEAKALQGQISGINAVLGELTSSQNEWNWANKDIKEAQERIKEVKAKMPDLCPTCKQPLPKAKVEVSA